MPEGVDQYFLSLQTALAGRYSLETIRLDLLRLRGGIGSVETVTADLEAARAVGEQIDRLLQGHGEIEAALAPGPLHN